MSPRAAILALVAVMAAFSAAALPYDYRFPKQDFEGAMHFVESHAGQGDPVVTVGAATIPYREYFHQTWQGISSTGQLQTVQAQGRPVWVLYTMSGYIQSVTPDIMNALRSECAVAGVFRGTLADGDVTVCTMPPAPALLGR